jgi:GTP-binding protein LepA
MQLVVDHRGETSDMVYLSEKSVEIHFDIPLAELILDFFDQLKSRTKGTPRSTTRLATTARATS